MATKTTSKSTVAKTAGRKAERADAAKPSSRPRPVSKVAKPKAPKTEGRVVPGAKHGVHAEAGKPKPPQSGSLPVTASKVSAKPAEPPKSATKSAFAPITAKKPAPKPAPPETPPAAKPIVESVSLIDPQVPKTRRSVDETTKRNILPPISRIRASTVVPEPIRSEPPPPPVTPDE